MIQTKWIEEYTKDFNKSLEQWKDELEKMWGFRPDIDITTEVSFKISGTWTYRGKKYRLYNININPKNAQKARKPHLAVKHLISRMSHIWNNYHHTGWLWQREYVAKAKESPTPSWTGWAKEHYDKPENYKPPTPLEYKLFPVKAKKLAKLQEKAGIN